MNKYILMLLGCFILFSCVSSKIFEMRKQPEDFDISYPNNVYNERGLRECKPNAACNILHKRFWFKLRVQRLCQCPGFQECPTVWTNASNTHTIMLNNRSQMKFCNPINELPQCTSTKIALILMSNKTSAPDKYTRNHTTLITHQEAKIECQCQYPSYWMLENTTLINDNISISFFKCSELKKCNTNDFCGNIRADYYSSFYQCSCPRHHLCVFKDRSLQNVTELLYDGLAYRGICKSIDKKRKTKYTSI